MACVFYVCNSCGHIDHVGFGGKYGKTCPACESTDVEQDWDGDGGMDDDYDDEYDGSYEIED